MTSSITRSPIGAQDLYPWDGDEADVRFARTTQEGYTINLNPVMYQVDALVAFGGGVNYNYDTLYDCVTAQGSDERDVVLRPGTWDIDTNLTIPANINLVVPNGVMLTPASGITITVSGTVTAGPYQWIDESDGGTVTLSSHPQDAAWKGSTECLSVTALKVNGTSVTGDGLTVSATSRIIGRVTAGAGASEELTAAQALSILLASTAAGDLPYFSAANTLARLAKSTDGKVVRQASNVPSWDDAVKAGTAVASTSGTYIDFTSIPSWVKRITVMFSGVSTNGTSGIMVQIGDSGGVEASGYVAQTFYSVGDAGSTTYFPFGVGAAAHYYNGTLCLTLLDAATNTWAATGGLAVSTTCCHTSGTKSLSGVLDRVRIATVNGTDAFDAGLVNILYE